ncbi:hypothetical protein GOP47_0000690 [Adiantum capillus-veneris]|uniref:Uncharacterized protein n=1 Tax=Adiantum capillus-veneris TaxID=13818 RepID=A0A9D4ZSJ1_ADICA|nr:hypothetical protein GOP47_0000690 [Adiantum capillus-veneris]
MMRLIGALPIVDRGEVYKYCMEPQLKAPDELVTSLQPWYDMVRELHTQLGSRSSIALVGKDFCS